MLNLKPGDLFAEHYNLMQLVDTPGFAAIWEQPEMVFLTQEIINWCTGPQNVMYLQGMDVGWISG